MEILHHHWDTYRQLSEQEGVPEKLTKERVKEFRGYKPYKLSKRQNREKREEAIGDVIRAFRDKDVQMIYEGTGKTDRICQGCAADDCFAKHK